MRVSESASSPVKTHGPLAHPRPRVVTLDGEVIAPNGNMSADLRKSPRLALSTCGTQTLVHPDSLPIEFRILDLILTFGLGPCEWEANSLGTSSLLAGFRFYHKIYHLFGCLGATLISISTIHSMAHREAKTIGQGVNASFVSCVLIKGGPNNHTGFL